MIELWKKLDAKDVIKIVGLIAIQAVGQLVLPTMAAQILNASLELDKTTVIRIGIAMFIATILTIVAAYFGTKQAAITTQGLGNKIRKEVFGKVMSFSQEDMGRYGTSTLITRTTNDVMQVQMVTMMVVQMIVMSPIVIIVAAVFAYQTEARLAWTFIIVIPLIVVGVTILFKVVSPLFQSLQKKTDDLNQVFREGLTGIRVIRAFNTTAHEEERFNNVNKDFRDTSIKAFSRLASVWPILLISIGLNNVLIFINGSNLASTGTISVGNVIAVVQYGVIILNTILQISMILFSLPRAQVAAERINEILNHEPTIKNDEKTQSVSGADHYTLAFDRVSFGFSASEKAAIKDISFEVSTGEQLAIIGGTGSGKTTIANLIPRLIDASTGKITLNGVNIQSIEQSELRDLIGYATQQAVLFSGTIRSNMQYGKKDASDEEIWQALDIAQADFVRTLDKGLSSRVVQGGNNFSGGQRQRLDIARAIISIPAIYLFDDSFSALDFQTDANLRHALEPLTQNAISIIIAQRVNTVINADKIIVLDNGKISGIGTHEELLANNAVYKDIYESQTKGDQF